ncbi:MAG: thioredoxin family protein [Candidatus Sumerlaeia bacterium]|nr:thioredoxin family protein [Candidatus Sumerlaeia bacterium]
MYTLRQPSLQSVALAAAALLLAAGAMAKPGGAIEWIDNDLDAAKAQAVRTGKPVMVYFYNDRAKPCRTIEDEVFVRGDVRASADRFVRVAVNEEARRDLAAQFALMKVPTFIFLDSGMHELDRAVGPKSADALIAYLDRTNTLTISSGAGGSTGGAVPARFDTLAFDPRTPRAGAKPVNVTIEKSGVQKLFLVGDFCDWREQAIPMVRMGSSRWTTTLYLEDGLYDYRLLADGTTWSFDEANPLRRHNSYNDFNSVLMVGEHQSSPKITGRDISFTFYDAAAQRVAVAGTFTDWQQVEMFRHPTDTGVWGAKFKGLAPGKHEYKLVVDGRWINDPENLTPVKQASYINNTFDIK